MGNIKKQISLILISLFTISASGQFYDGMQMTFGKNRVQYYDYYWMYYRFDDFDCYFNEQGRELAQYTANYATKKLEEVEDFFDYSLEKRIIFIIYNKSAEYKQSNIGLESDMEDSYNTGGFSRIIDNKVSLYYESSHVDYQKQVAASITEIIVNEMLYDAETKNRISRSTSIDIPNWFLRGLMNYVAFGWDFQTEDRVKDGILSEKYKKINHLEYDDAEYAGQSFWRFIGKEYGDAIIPNIIYLTKVYKKIDKGFLYVTGKKLDELLDEWYEYYRNEYSDYQKIGKDIDNQIRKSKKEQIYQQVAVSPDGRYTAYITNDWGRRRIWLYDETTGKRSIIFRKEPKLEQEIDKSYPVMAWHPSSMILTFINEEKAGLKLYFYRIDEKSLESRNLLYFDKVLHFGYSPDGTRLVMSAVKNSMTDIYLHTIASATSEQITYDIADDLTPSFLAGEKDLIIFSSNRLSDTLYNNGDPLERVGLTFDLFTYDIAKKDRVVTRLAEGEYVDRLAATGTTTSDIRYLGNANGIINRYIASLDSTISYIDTATHYRYYIESRAVTDYERNIEDYSASANAGKIREIVYNQGRNILKDTKEIEDPTSDPKLTEYRLERTQMLHEADSLEQLRQWLVAEDRRRRDTLTKPIYEYFATNEPIDISHYIFEKEKQNYYDELWRKDYMDIDLDTGRLEFPQIQIYETAFYYNYMATQIDFSFLNSSYQIYSGGSGYYNPGVNMMSTIGTIDMFENYRITGGFRFSGNFDSNEYLLSLDNLKGKYDKQFVFHRQGYYSYSETSVYKTHTHNIYTSLSRPITPALAVKGTLKYRLDNQESLAYDMISLEEEGIKRHWVSAKAEVIYDDTRERSINIYYGTRFKIFGELYKELFAARSNMIVVGADFRNYIKIHRELIWANRFAASTSFGPTRLLYYLGGVDNWMGYLFNRSAPMYDTSIPVNTDINYGFQALATNMRGFSQNARNGTNFAVLNSEIRWPVIRYFAGHPLKSNFLNSLQVVGFGDLGSAWVGPTPWSGKNAYDTKTYENGPIKVIVDSNHSPIICGFGFGARAQIAGYFVRADWSWGIDNYYILPRMFYLSFSRDF